MIKFLVLSFSLMSFTLASAKSLTFEVNGKKISHLSGKTLSSGVLTFKKVQIGSVDRTLFNIWRKVDRTYRGYDLYEVLDEVFGSEWRKAKQLSFEALDGYRQTVKISKMLRSAEDDHFGLIAFKETGKKGFTKFIRKGKWVDLGPYYIVWNGFERGDKASHDHPLKWPYQLKTINLIR